MWGTAKDCLLEEIAALMVDERRQRLAAWSTSRFQSLLSDVQRQRVLGV